MTGASSQFLDSARVLQRARDVGGGRAAARAAPALALLAFAALPASPLGGWIPAFALSFALVTPFVFVLRPRWLTFLAGATAVAAGAVVAESLAANWAGALTGPTLVLLVVAPVTEELLKFGFAVWGGATYRSAAGVAIGFAATENGVYFLAAWGEPLSQLVLLVVIRAITDPLVHINTTTLTTSSWRGSSLGLPAGILLHMSWNGLTLILALLPVGPALLCFAAAVTGLLALLHLQYRSPSERAALEERGFQLYPEADVYGARTQRWRRREATGVVLVGAAVIAVLLLVLVGLTFMASGPGATASSSPKGKTPVPGPAAWLDVPIEIYNSQPVATGVYQQLVDVPSSTYSQWIAANWSNVEFVYGNGTTIPAWIEANASAWASVTPVWLKLGSITATTRLLVNMAIGLQSQYVLWPSGSTGAAPQLSGTWGLHDNGAAVFPRYWNWSGTRLPSDWTVQDPAHMTASIDNGLALSSTAPGEYMLTSESLGWNQSLDGVYSISGSSGNGWYILYDPNFSDLVGGEGPYTYRFFGSDTETSVAFPVGVADEVGIGAERVSGSTTVEQADLNESVYATSAPSGASVSPGPAEFYMNQGITIHSSWTRFRSLPPNAVMPVVTFLPIGG